MAAISTEPGLTRSQQMRLYRVIAMTNSVLKPHTGKLSPIPPRDAKILDIMMAERPFNVVALEYYKCLLRLGLQKDTRYFFGDTRINLRSLPYNEAKKEFIRQMTEAMADADSHRAGFWSPLWAACRPGVKIPGDKPPYSEASKKFGFNPGLLERGMFDFEKLPSYARVMELCPTLNSFFLKGDKNFLRSLPAVKKLHALEELASAPYWFGSGLFEELRWLAGTEGDVDPVLRQYADAAMRSQFYLLLTFISEKCRIIDTVLDLQHINEKFGDSLSGIAKAMGMKIFTDSCIVPAAVAPLYDHSQPMSSVFGHFFDHAYRSNWAFPTDIKLDNYEIQTLVGDPRRSIKISYGLLQKMAFLKEVLNKHLKNPNVDPSKDAVRELFDRGFSQIIAHERCHHEGAARRLSLEGVEDANELSAATTQVEIEVNRELRDSISPEREYIKYMAGGLFVSSLLYYDIFNAASTALSRERIQARLVNRAKRYYTELLGLEKTVMPFLSEDVMSKIALLAAWNLGEFLIMANFEGRFVPKCPLSPFPKNFSSSLRDLYRSESETTLSERKEGAGDNHYPYLSASADGIKARRLPYMSSQDLSLHAVKL